MTLDCSGLQNGQSRVISFFGESCMAGGRARFFAACSRNQSSKEIRGIETRQSRLERKTLLEENSVLPP